MASNKLTHFSFTGLMQVGCLFVLLFSIASFLVPISWYFENFSHFRFQYLVFSVVFLIYFSFLKSKTFTVISLAIFLINSVYILPSYIKIQYSEDVSHHINLKLFHSNVLTPNTHYLKLIEQLHKEDPDIVVLQEVDKLWIKNLVPIKTIYPHFIEQPQADNFGIALYSKVPISEHKTHYWTDLDLPSIEAEFNLDGVAFHILATHPLPPVNKYYYDQRNLQLKAIAKSTRNITTAKIVIGDLNTTIWSKDYRVLETSTGLFNVSKGFGFIPTWPTNLMPLMIPIDHCLVSKHFKVVGVKSGDNFGSDHLPLIVELQL
jgi:endonuclease/exonuclease/phosphatase (EEP) superfamily protein YafD